MQINNPDEFLNITTPQRKAATTNYMDIEQADVESPLMK